MDSIMNRQIVEHQLGLDEEEEVKGHGPLRPAFDNLHLAHFAEYMDEKVPASTPLMDWLFGEKTRIVNHEPEWWRQERPRPYRGETADPSIPAAERKEYEEMQRKIALEAADKADKEAQREKEAREEKQAKEDEKFLKLATAEAQKRRLEFFGRPAQKFTLKKRQLQLERNAWEQQAAMFLHLHTDAEREYKHNQNMNKQAAAAKAKAANAAATYRAEERGARTAAKSLKLGGRQLAEAKQTAEDAEAKYAALAAEQESEARKQRLIEEKAAEEMAKEEEKMSACKGQIKFIKGKAKTVFEQAAEAEINEIKALVAEKLLLRDFHDVWEAKKVPKGSPLEVQKENKMAYYDEREDVVSMEMNMFVHMYTRVEFDDKYDDEIPYHFAYKQTEKGTDFLNLPEPLSVTWIEKLQEPGMICLGRVGKGPVLANRKKVVQHANQPFNQIPKFKKMKDNAEMKKLWEDLVDEEGKELEEEVTENIGKKSSPIILNPAYFADTGPTYISREALASGAKKPDSELTPEVFKRLWGDDPRHKVSVKIDAVKLLLRHPPAARWLSTWIPKLAQDKLDKDKGTVTRDRPLSKVLLTKPFESYNLGPLKRPFRTIPCPALHPADTPGNIDGSDQQPRVAAKVMEWVVERGTEVNAGDVIAKFRVADTRKSGPAAQKFTPQKWEEEVKGKELQDHVREGLRRCNEIYVEENGVQINVIEVKAPCHGILTGMMRDEKSRVLSFDDIASIDEGVEGWDELLLPVAEWPGP